MFESTLITLFICATFLTLVWVLDVDFFPAVIITVLLLLLFGSPSCGVNVGVTINSTPLEQVEE